MPYLWPLVVTICLSLCLIPHRFHQLTDRLHVVRLDMPKCGEEKTAHVLIVLQQQCNEPRDAHAMPAAVLGLSIRIRGMKLRSKYCKPTQIATHPTHSPVPWPHRQQSIFPSVQ